MLKRALWMFPTLIVISLIAFLISANSRFDPVENICHSFGEGVSYEDISACRDSARKDFNLYLPVFYVSISSWAEPKDLHVIYPRSTRESIQRLSLNSGNWPAVQTYFSSIRQFYDSIAFFELPDSLENARIQKLRTTRQDMLFSVGAIMDAKSENIIQIRLEKLENLILSDSVFEGLIPGFEDVERNFLALDQNRMVWKSYLPRIIWHGTQCQYHQWLAGILFRGDFGKSYTKGFRPVSERIGSLVFYSFLFTTLSVLLGYLIGIMLGILAAMHPGGWFDRLSGVGVFALDAMPAFWVATLLLMFFANTENLNWFPSSFVVIHPEGWEPVTRFVLPLIAYTYGAFASVSRILRVSLLEVVNQDFIRTAKAKGLSQKVVMVRHALRNSLLPMITGFVGIFPAMLSGSVVLERIFGIPGMGNEIMEAMLNNNTPMMLAVFTLMGALTILGYLVADILYAWADPRIRFGKENSSE